MKLDKVIEQKGRVNMTPLTRIETEVSKKAPVAGERMLDRVRSFKEWWSSNEGK